MVNPPPGFNCAKNPPEFSKQIPPKITRTKNPPPGFEQPTELSTPKNIPPLNISLANLAQKQTARKAHKFDPAEDLARYNKSIKSCNKENVGPQKCISLGDMARQQQNMNLSEKKDLVDKSLTGSKDPEKYSMGQLASSQCLPKEVEQSSKKPNISLAALANGQSKEGPQTLKTGSVEDNLTKNTGNKDIINSENVCSSMENTSSNISLAALASSQTSKQVVVTSKQNTQVAGISLADLALNQQQKELSHTDKSIISVKEHKSTSKSAGFSLAALAQIHQVKNVNETESQGTISLASLAARHEKVQNISSENLSRSPKVGQTLSSSPLASNISLSDLAKLHSKVTSVSEQNVNKEFKIDEDKTQKDQSVSVMPPVLSMESSKFNAEASDFGKALCAVCLQNRKSSSRKFTKFAYTHQISSKHRPETALYKIVPFDFSTPSPDDRVLNKQKAAFGVQSKYTSTIISFLILLR